MELQPISYKQACQFIDQYHRHHRPPQGWKFGMACYDDGRLCGVATIGRPINRDRDDGYTAEVTRLCTDGTKNACSYLYSAAWRAARAIGYKRMITYILETENGASLRASNWTLLYKTKAKPWNNSKRSRIDRHPICDKWCYGIGDIEDLKSMQMVCEFL